MVVRQNSQMSVNEHSAPMRKAELTATNKGLTIQP